MISGTGYVQCDDYIRALLHEPDQSEMDDGMSRGQSLCYSQSRRLGDCCEGKNGCGRSVEEPRVSGKTRE